MKKAVLYCQSGCPYCTGAERLLAKKGVEIEKRHVDRDPGLWDDIFEAGRETVPHILIGETLVGGFDDLQDMEEDGELDTLLAD